MKVPDAVRNLFVPSTSITLGEDVRLFRLVHEQKAGKNYLNKVPIQIARETNPTENKLSALDFTKVIEASEAFGRPYASSNAIWYKERTATTITGVIKAGLNLPFDMLSGAYNLVANRRFLFAATVISGVVIYQLNQDPKCKASFEAGGKCLDTWFTATLASITAAKCHSSLQGFGACVDGTLKFGYSTGFGALKWFKSQIPG